MKSPFGVKVPNIFGSGLGSSLTGLMVMEEQVIVDRSMRGDTFMTRTFCHLLLDRGKLDENERTD